MIGDRPADVETGLNAGIHAAAVCTGKRDAAAWQELAIPGIHVFPDLAGFVATLAPEA